MKKQFLFLFFLTLTGFSAYAQSFNDTIFTKINDTILCQITMVNDHNIFFNFKKKKKIKSNYISREQVLSYESSNQKTLKIIGRTEYPKCDTCSNYIVLNSGDTIFYGIKLNYLIEDKKLINSISINSNSYTLYGNEDILSVKWENIDYTRIILCNQDRISLYDRSKAYRLYQDDWLGYEIVEGKIPLMIFGYSGMRIILLPFMTQDPIISYDYCIKINDQYKLVPIEKKEFQSFAQQYFSDKKDLIEDIENGVLTRDNIEKILQIYNQK